MMFVCFRSLVTLTTIIIANTAALKVKKLWRGIVKGLWLGGYDQADPRDEYAPADVVDVPSDEPSESLDG